VSFRPEIRELCPVLSFPLPKSVRTGPPEWRTPVTSTCLRLARTVRLFVNCMLPCMAASKAIAKSDSRSSTTLAITNGQVRLTFPRPKIYPTPTDFHRLIIDTNHIIILYRQATVDYSVHSIWDGLYLSNPNACFDWVGWYGSNADQKGGWFDLYSSYDSEINVADSLL
jgi:hypothetical protein